MVSSVLCSSTAKQLAVSPKDAHTWQRLADNSKGVSESIKRLVAAIRDAAPGQTELDRTIRQLEHVSEQLANMQSLSLSLH